MLTAIPRPVPGPSAASGAPATGCAAAYLEELVTRQHRQRPRHRFKIIDQAHGGKSMGSAQFARIDHPGTVGERAAAVLDDAGGGKDRAADFAHLRQTAKIRAECLAKAAVVAHGHMGDHADRSAGQDREPRVGPADVREQHLARASCGGCRHRRRAVLIKSAYQRNDAFGMRRCVG